MMSYIVRRILLTIPLLIIVSFLSFALMQLSPGDPAEVSIRVSGTLPTPELVSETKARLGLDQPFFSRYLTWIGNVIQGDFGRCFVNNLPVAEEIANAFPATLKLASTSCLFMILISLGIAFASVLRRGSLIDTVLRLFLFITTAIPAFWAGILLLWLFAVKLTLLPVAGMDRPGAVILPALTLALPYINTYVRLLRSAMLKTLQTDFVSYERGRGLARSTILRHVLTNSLHSSLTALGMSLPKLMAGAFVIECIFAWPGLGRLCISAIFNRDLPLIQAYVLLMASLFIFSNLLMDILKRLLTPRSHKEASV